MPLISLNATPNRLPRWVIAATAAAAIREAMPAYSIAIAPESSEGNALNRSSMTRFFKSTV
jgi:hypothetical protein